MGTGSGSVCGLSFIAQCNLPNALNCFSTAPRLCDRSYWVTVKFSAVPQRYLALIL